MEKQTNECRHYLRIWRRDATEERAASLWARCQNCKRRWFLGTDVESVLAAGEAAR